MYYNAALSLSMLPVLRYFNHRPIPTRVQDGCLSSGAGVGVSHIRYEGVASRLE
jgi:hypothetical protein